MKICEFVKPEIDYLLAECNFTNDEEVLFLMRSKDIPLEECAEKMDISVSTVYRISKKIKQKVEKVFYS